MTTKDPYQLLDTSTATANSVLVAGATTAASPMTVDSSTGAVAGFATTLNNQTGTTYTLLSTDAGKTVTLNNAGAITVTLPNSFPAQFTCECIQLGAGQVTFTTSGGSIQNRSTQTKIAGQYGAVRLTVVSNAGSAAIYNLAGDTG